MKKIIFLIIICALTSCDPHMSKYEGRWYIKNNTSEVIKIELTYKDHTYKNTHTISLGDSAGIWGVGKLRYLKELPVFNDFANEDRLHIDVYTEDDILITSWNNETEVGRQSDIFKEESWRTMHRENHYQYSWIYDFNPENMKKGMTQKENF